MVLQIVHEAGSGRAGQQPELGRVGGLGCHRRHAHREELDTLVLGLGRGRVDVGVPGVVSAVGHEHGHPDAARHRFVEVELGEVGDGVGGVGAVPDVADGRDPGPEGRCASPVTERVLDEHGAGVLQQRHSGH